MQAPDPDRIELRTEGGLAYCLEVLQDQKFLLLRAYLPLRADASQDEKVAYAHGLNGHILLPSFRLDDDDDLGVSYMLPYHHGLIAGQFAAIARRFGAMLDFLVRKQNDDELIDFDKYRREPAAALLN
ncbi:hypothetical protein [Cupriavidus sp. DF5525]|uniref:hypothetical protein n=1 Tax=Cupriavidus sp. DF5525 TaxID=3160989 RepID=UPI0032DE45CC